MNYDDLKIVTTVDVRKQLKPSEYVSFDGAGGKGLRVLFVGNSITLHGINEAIGRDHVCGMAASCPEKDYVHLCYKHIRKRYPDAVFGICQVGMWERQYATGEQMLPAFTAARDFEADVILVKLAGNCSVEGYNEAAFAEQFSKLIAYLNPTGKAQVIVSTEFHRHPAEAAMRTYAEEHGCLYCVISDLSQRPEVLALGLYEHEGVANHPGDLGMAVIAQRYCDAFERLAL